MLIKGLKFDSREDKRQDEKRREEKRRCAKYELK